MAGELIISGAGVAEVNGTYDLAGTHASKNYYVKQDAPIHYVFFDDSIGVWSIYTEVADNGAPFYFKNGDDPWGQWSENVAPGPAPTVAEGITPADRTVLVGGITGGVVHHDQDQWQTGADRVVDPDGRRFALTSEVAAAASGIQGAVDTYAELPDATTLDLGAIYIVRQDSGAPSGGGLYRVEDSGGGGNTWVFLDALSLQNAAEVSFDNTTSGLTATTVQSAIDEVQGALGSAAQADIGTAEGEVVALTSGGKLPTAVLPDAVLGGVNYQGTWDASTNTPAIPAAATENKGYYYRISTPGSTDIDGTSDWGTGDWIVSNGATWEKIDNSEAVTSVAGKTGAVTLAIADVAGLQDALDSAGVSPDDVTIEISGPGYQVSDLPDASYDGTYVNTGNTTASGNPIYSNGTRYLFYSEAHYGPGSWYFAATDNEANITSSGTFYWNMSTNTPDATPASGWMQGVSADPIGDVTITATTGGLRIKDGGHDHDGRYYTETEVDTLLGSIDYADGSSDGAGGSAWADSAPGTLKAAIDRVATQVSAHLGTTIPA